MRIRYGFTLFRRMRMREVCLTLWLLHSVNAIISRDCIEQNLGLTATQSTESGQDLIKTFTKICGLELDLDALSLKIRRLEDQVTSHYELIDKLEQETHLLGIATCGLVGITMILLYILGNKTNTEEPQEFPITIRMVRTESLSITSRLANWFFPSPYAAAAEDNLEDEDDSESDQQEDTRNLGLVRRLFCW